MNNTNNKANMMTTYVNTFMYSYIIQSLTYLHK